jgi:glycosidase
MQNLLGSHDTDRVASRIVNRDLVPMRNWPEYCEKARFSNPAYQVRKPRAHEYAVQKLLALFQMTYVGAPMIYYGDEAGMWGASDPCCRKPMVWGDMRYADEVFLPDGGRRPVPDPVSFNDEMYEHYRELIRLRTRYEALQLGDFRTLLTDDRAQLYAFCREHKDQRIIVVINNGSVPAGCTLPAEPGRWYMDVLNEGKRFLADDRGALSVTTEPLWGRILVRRRAAAPHH